MLSLVFIPIFIVFFLLQNKFVQFCIISLVILFPFSFGDISSVRSVLIIEWLSPIFLLIAINDLLPLRYKKGIIEFSGTRIFLFAISILTIWITYSYVNNEILNPSIITGKAAGVRRLYFTIFSNILLFLSVIIFFYANHEKIDIPKWLKVLIYSSILIGIVRIFAYFLNFDTPLLVGVFDYNPAGRTRFGGIAYRIGGLTEAAAVGFSALIAYFQITRRINFVAALIFFLFVFLSGGRTIMVGLAVALFIYSIFFQRKYIVYMTVLVIVTLGLVFIFAPKDMIEGQIGRLTAFEGGIKEQDRGRFVSYALSLQNFKNNPVFGKGIGHYDEFVPAYNEKEARFIREQLFSGGHGSYISILGTLGFGGIFYLLTMIIGGVVLSFVKIKEYLEINEDVAAVSTFTFLLLIMIGIYYITSYNGLTDPTLFFTVGLIASIRIIENKEHDSDLQENSFSSERDNELVSKLN